MFSDLAAVPDAADAFSRQETLLLALRLGFDCIAVVHPARERLSERDRCNAQPWDLLTLTSTDSRVQEALRFRRSLLWQQQAPQPLTQLSRLTLVTGDSAAAAQAFGGENAVAASYDLLAIQPTSERVLQQACSTLEVDIIALDLTQRLPFKLRPGLLQAAIRRGLYFEVQYSPALQQEAARRSIFAQALALARACGGRGIILSSGARTAFELRGPYDVMNLGTLFDLSQDQSKAAVAANCEAVLQHARLRKAARGAIAVAAEPAAASSGAAAAAGPSTSVAASTSAPAADALTSAGQMHGIQQGQGPAPMQTDQQPASHKRKRRRR